MSANELYDIVRGVWRVDPRRAERAKFAFAVVDGKIFQIYEVHDWHPANTTPYDSGRCDQSDAKYSNRFEFTGKIAPPGIRAKYIAHSVNHLFGSGQVIRYLNC